MDFRELKVIVMDFDFGASIADSIFMGEYGL